MTQRARPTIERIAGLAVYRKRVGSDRPESTVVFVHGSMDRAASFVNVVRRLGDVDTIRYDRRGYGRSLGAGVAMTIDEHVNDLATVIDGQPCVVIGHSFGGVVALAAAAKRAAPIVAVGSFEAPMPWSDWWPRRSAGRLAMQAGPQEAAAAECFMRRMIGDEHWERLPESTRRQRRAEGRALVAELRQLEESVPPFDLIAIEVPIVSGYGSASFGYHRRASEEVAKIARRGELVVINGAAHRAHASHPDDFAKFVRRTVLASRVKRS
ncbi:MAG: alpha/beta hydrolase [Acidimicrobiales bacterium]|nr:alpha/beta hydrolase [Acidimicrobiales bacterium]